MHKWLRYAAGLILLQLLSGLCGAQQLALALYRRFSPSVITQVYEINKDTHLNSQQQWYLAVQLNKKDSTLAAMILKGNSSSIIDEYTRQAWRQIRDLDGVKPYYDSLAARKARGEAREEWAFYQKYKPSAECEAAIEKLLFDKYYQVALLNETFPPASIVTRRTTTDPETESTQRRIVARQDSLAQAALIHDGVLAGSSLFMAAIRLKPLLHLTSGQVDSLVERGQHMTYMRDSAWRIDPVMPLDTKGYENYYLSTILTEEQFTNLLSIRYKPDAEVSAGHDWNDMVKRGLVHPEDKDKTVQELTRYYVLVKSASSLYAYDLSKQSAFARSVKDDMPRSLKTLQYARSHNITQASAAAEPAATQQ